MTDVIDVLMCAGAASWELAIVRGLQPREVGIRVARRCADHGELLGTALRDRPRAVLLDASLPWIDRDFVATLRRAGVEVFAIGSSARPLERIGARRFTANVTADEIAAALYGLGAPTPSADLAVMPSPRTGIGRLVVVWSGAGSPGRTMCAIHLALEAARSGLRTLLIDADVWAASIAQTLDLAESPSLAQAALLASEGWRSPLTDCVQSGPEGLSVLAGLARSELWPEVREESWRAILGTAIAGYEVVVVDVAAPIEEDEELAFDRVPFRRNLVTTLALELADHVALVAATDPVGLRRAVVAHRTLIERSGATAAELSIVLNRAPRAGRRLQECSRTVSDWMGDAPAAFLPEEPAFDRVRWEGRSLHDVAPRSRWLRELRPLLDGIRI